MGPFGEFLTAILKMLGLTFGMMVLLTVFLIVFIDIWGKRMTEGHVYCYFWHNRFLSGRLLKEDPSERCVYLGSGADREKYNLEDSKQGWMRWPPGLPKLVQTPVRAYEFYRNYSEPRDIDPAVEQTDEEIPLTGRTNAMITDEAMVKQAWKDVRESLGLRTGRSPIGIHVILALIVLLAVGLNIYLNINNQQTIQSILPALENLLPPLGGG